MTASTPPRSTPRSGAAGHRSIWSGLRRAVAWHRRKLAVLAAIVAVLAGVQAARADPYPTTDVVVTVRSLPGGHTLTDDDVRLAPVPAAMLPEDAVRSTEIVVGRTLAAPAPRGRLLSGTDVVSPRMMLGDSAAVVAPLRLADPQLVALLVVGDEVDVVAADPQDQGRVTVVAERARVVAIPTGGGDSGPLGLGAGSSSGQLVLVAVPPSTARQLATAAATSQMSIMWRS